MQKIDNSQEGKGSITSDVFEGKAFLLHRPSVKKVNDSAARAIGDSDRLLERAASISNLARALLKVAHNQGATGVDGRGAREVVDDAPRLLPRLRLELLSGAYRPGDIRRVWIPKPGSGQRRLGPTMPWIAWCNNDDLDVMSHDATTL